MGIKTAIEWTDHTWSPWFGCAKVSTGCLNCYAAGWAHRFGKAWGRGTERPPTNQWDLPVRWNRQAERQYRALAHSTPAGQPIQFRRPTVFPSSIDWLDEDVPAELLARFLQLIHGTPYLRWLLLTKRPENFMRQVDRQALCRLETMKDPQQVGLREWLGQWINGQPPANVWVGTSVEDQTRANERIPALLRIPAVGRFLSVEPLLGPVDLEPFMQHGRDITDEGYSRLDGIHWVIIGGESGHGARPCDVEWIRSLVRQCKDASVSVFVKQLGTLPVDRNDRGFEGDSGPSGWPMDTDTVDDILVGVWQGKPVGILLKHPKGGDPAEWPEDIRVREFPEGLR